MAGGLDLESVFGPHGRFAGVLGGQFEPRAGQIQMAKAVADAIATGEDLIVEAGTGTGKTFAYVAPAVMLGKRLWVATATRALQDQLVEKDLPLIAAALGRDDLAITNLKGAANYLCKYKFAQLHDGQLTLEDLGAVGRRELLAEVAAWSLTTQTGDFAELGNVAPSDPLLSKINGAGDMCHGERCQLYAECHVTAVRQKARSADVIVTNQALYLAAINSYQQGPDPLLPPHDVAVIDEAHQLESFASSAFSVEITRARWQRLARNLRTARALTGMRMPPAGGLDIAAEPFFNRLDRYVTDMAGGSSDGPYRRQVPIDAESRDRFVDFISDQASSLISSLDLIARSLRESLETEDPKFGPLLPVLASIQDLLEALNYVLGDHDPDYIFHLQPDRQDHYGMIATPLSVAPILADRMFGPDRLATSVTLTSATLATAGNFEFARSRIGLTNAIERQIESPFDLQRQALLYVPANMPPPRVGARETELGPIADQIVQLVESCPGGVFILCTSLRRMRQFHSLVEPALPDRTCLLQGQASTRQLLIRFRRSRNAVLFATKGFWQGVDIRGGALAMVIIDRLPFPAPSDPVFAARCRAIEQQKGSSFGALSLPLTAIDLKQGFGRLIRSQSDIGVLALLEDRILTKRYGNWLLRSLPNLRITRSIDEVAAHLEPLRRGADPHGI